MLHYADSSSWGGGAHSVEYTHHESLRVSSRWVFKQLYDKGLVYRGVKVMPFSTACNTPLSNFESHQNYKVRIKQRSLH